MPWNLRHGRIEAASPVEPTLSETSDCAGSLQANWPPPPTLFMRKRNLIAFSGSRAKGCAPERTMPKPAGAWSAKEVPQHLVDGIGKFDLGKVAGAIEDLKFALWQYLDQDSSVVLDRVDPVLAPGNHEYGEIQFRCDLFRAVAIGQSKL